MKSLLSILLLASAMFLISSCGDDDFEGQTMEFTYQLHNGQAVPSAAYGGIHPNDFSAKMSLVELENGNTNITVTLNNTVSGATYNIHAHDAADAATTPNGTPYNETPNGDVFASPAEGNGSTVTVTQEAKMSFDALVNDYEAFFVIHDPMQYLSTLDISTYLVVGSFARAQEATNLASSTFSYDFNEGQVAAAFAYTGSHADNLQATIQVDELANSSSRVTVRIMNTMDGETYHTHAHDMADSATTPNGTPYIETPNADVFAAPIMGNGGMAGLANVSTMSYSEIIATYDGFFVVHDPLQAITTTDPTTYVVLGIFAR